MKPIIYETSPGHIEGEVFDVMIDKRNEYIPILDLVVKYNSSMATESPVQNQTDYYSERAQTVQLFLDRLNLSEYDPSRHFIISSDEAAYVESQLTNDGELQQELKRRMQCAIYLVQPISLGLHQNPALARAYRGAEYETRNINRSLARFALQEHTTVT